MPVGGQVLTGDEAASTVVSATWDAKDIAATHEGMMIGTS
jgi:hypothetical protein